MSEIKQYEDKDGNRIRATSKAYEMYYRKIGFNPVGAANHGAEDVGTSSKFSTMKVADLRQYLKDEGIVFDPKAKREELEALANQTVGNAGEITADDTAGDAENPEEDSDTPSPDQE